MKRHFGGRNESPAISGGSKRICCGHYEQGYTLQRFMEKMDPSDLLQVQDLCRKYCIDVPHLLTRTPKYRLQFKNKLPDILFTDKIFRDENDREVEIVIVDPLDRVISFGDMAMAVVEIFVHDGDANGQWTDEEFKPPVLVARKDKRPLLVGNLFINICNGVGYIKDAKFTDNSSWTKSKTFRLGVRLYEGTIKAGEVQDGISNAFRVKDRHGERNRKDRPPTMDDKVCCLKGISKNGPLHKKLVEFNVKTVRDFLCYCSKHHFETLRTRIGMTEGTWKKAYGHAKESERCSDILLNGPVNLLTPQNSIVVAGSNPKPYVLVQPNDVLQFPSYAEFELPISSDMFSSAQIFHATKSGFESSNTFKTFVISSEEAWKGTERRYGPIKFCSSSISLSHKWLKPLSIAITLMKWRKLLIRYKAHSRCTKVPSKKKNSETSSSRDNADESCSYGSEPNWGELSPIVYVTP